METHLRGCLGRGQGRRGGESEYVGGTIGVRKRFSHNFQMEANYCLSRDKDDDSNERDPFTDRSFTFYDLIKDYGPSDRDIRHKFTFFAFGEIAWGHQANARIQARTAQPITTSPRVQNGQDRGRNWDRKDNGYFSFDWRLQRPFTFGGRYQVIPILEMFNTSNSLNTINPLTPPALFDFSGFLRLGVGDPRQVQLAVKFTFWREVVRASCGDPASRIERASDLSPFLRRRGDRDCLRVLGKLEGWFLRQYDVDHAAAVIHHADRVARGEPGDRQVLSRHRTRNYLAVLGGLLAPLAAAAFAYERAPRVFDAICAAELLLVGLLALWFLFYRFCWRRNLTVFRASVPRIAAGIIVGYLPIFFIDEVWALAGRSVGVVASVSLLLAMATLLYIYIEVQRRLGNTDVAFSRARQIFVLGVLQAFGIGLVLTGLLGPFMAGRNWGSGDAAVEALRASLPPLLGQLPEIVGIGPFLVFPAAVVFMTFLYFFIGTFLQLMWEDLPITEPL